MGDLKKVVAFSTTSQLGLILLTVRFLNFRLLIFHILYHAFSKAIIFISTRIPIHMFNNFQDFRKINFISSSQILVFKFCLIFGSLSLIRIYFCICFYSKDKFLFNIFNSNYSILFCIIFILSSYCTFRYSKTLIKYTTFTPFNYFSKKLIFNRKIFIKIIFKFLILTYINSNVVIFNSRFLSQFEVLRLLVSLLPILFLKFLNDTILHFKKFSFNSSKIFNIDVFHINNFKQFSGDPVSRVIFGI